jgi:hypothetical protein
MTPDNRRKGQTILAKQAANVVRSLCFLAFISACQARESAPGAPAGAAGAPAAERAYHPPPKIVSMAPTAGAIAIDGVAAPGARVRVASPSGAVLFTQADRKGRWRLMIARSTKVRLFGVSMTEAGRTIQSEGYLVIPPTGPAAQLRAGSGAVVFAQPAPGLRLLAVDYDGKGGAVVSGVAPSGAGLTLEVDGAPRATTRADTQGRFSMALDEPPFVGGHDLVVVSGASQAEVTAPTSQTPARPAPFEASPSDGGWRIDWMTPGGGAQTTLVLGESGRSK